MRKENLQSKKEPEPFRCPQCTRILFGVQCPCGFMVTRKTRPVIQENGELKEYAGDIYHQKVVKKQSDTEKKWIMCYWQAKHSGMTFKQAIGNFVRQYHYWPPENLPMMPKLPTQFYSKVIDVPPGELIR